MQYITHIETKQRKERIMKNLEAKVVKALVKNGFNENDAVAMVENNLNDALKIRPEAKPAKLAEVIVCIM
ncbi:hypothetical protein BI032_gp016 [Citrobacter phage vB_CfrM_CfP1]|jgi:hypothetical protein|uniref:Uncharacterized protein n=2 Tax=Pseudotevenvirus miller TaxID=2843956 RepID=A0A1B1IXW3_9CAUD|nr:hypothetical protein BI032_gp016 [Citrobacter phage vB_CfrM_CfP1]ANS06164.1 hypothetical protein ABCD_0016 [Citrobacter phage vB_CfrM_CfP1]